MRPRRLGANVGVLTTSALAVRALGAATGVVVARVLGPSGRGELAILLVVGAVAGTIVSAGLDLWAARALPSQRDGALVLRVLRRHEWWSALAVVVVTAAVGVLTDVPSSILWGTALLTWATGASMLTLGLLQGIDEMRSYAAAIFAGMVAYTAALAVLVATGHGSLGWILVANIVGTLGIAAYPHAAAARRTRQVEVTSGLDEVGADHGSAMRFGLPSLIGGLVAMGLYRADVVLVGLWRSSAAAGRYSVAIVVAEVLYVLPNSVAQAVVPRAAGTTVDVPKVSRLLVGAMVVVAAAVAVLGWVGIPLVFGADYASARAALPGLAVASVAAGVWKLYSFLLLGRGDPAARVRSGAVGVAVMVLADTALVPLLGIAGASLGALLGYGAAASWCVRAWRRRSGGSLRDLFVVRRPDLALVWSRLRRRSRPATVPLLTAKVASTP